MSARRESILNRLLVIVTLLLVVLLAACGDDDKDTSDKSGDQYTIGIINLTTALDPVIDGFKSQMEELGYIEGENTTYIYDGPPDSIDKLDSIAQSLVETDVDLILSISTPATLAVKRATAENPIPCVFGPVQDPIGSGLVSSMSEPGGNLTGVTFGLAEGKRLEWLTRVAPDIKRIYVAYNIDDPSPVAALELVSEAAEKLGVELVLHPIHNIEEAAAAVENIPDDVDAIMNLPDAIMGQFSVELTNASLEHKLPLSVPLCDGVADGALMSYGAETTAAGEQTARLADQILKGTDPAELPVEVTEFFLAINLESAEAMGLTIPDDVLESANIIIRGDE